MSICHNWQRVNCVVLFPSMSTNIRCNALSRTTMPVS
uniref:Uncharacterized protein n=1 Tax=Arundo donax TaxID=35708 RepID=A0A0A9GZU9_ARUDO